MCIRDSAYLALRWGELKGVGEQVVEDLIDIIRHEAHLYLILRLVDQLYVSTRGIVTIRVDDHGNMGRDIAPTSARIADRRLDLGDV